MLLRRCGGGVTASSPKGSASTASGSDFRPAEGSASSKGLLSAFGGRALFLLRCPAEVMQRSLDWLYFAGCSNDKILAELMT